MENYVFIFNRLGSSFSKPSRVSDHNYKFNQNPAGHDYNG